MPTVLDLVNETRRQLTGSTRSQKNKLNGALLVGSTTFTFTYSLNFGAGSMLSLDDELVYVWSVDTATKTAVVERAQLGTTAAAHADGTLVEVNPEFPKVRIKQALKDDILSWHNDLFQVASVSASVSSAYLSQGINVGVSDDWHYILDVRLDTTSNKEASYSKSWPQVKFEVIRNADTTDFTNGAAIVITEPVPTGNVRITYAKRFDCSTFDDSTDVEAAVGLGPTMLDIPPLGAAWRLETPREVKRTQTYAQGDSRVADEVEAGAILRTGQFLKVIRDQRINEERARLRAKYPVRHE